MLRPRCLYHLLFLAGFFLLPSYLRAQTTQVQFGQNRVQYHDFDWQFYDEKNFTIYFYPGGQELGKFVLETANADLENLENLLDFHFSSRIDILIYNDITDMAQSNIGLGNENYNIGGTTRIYEDKIFLYFDGNHLHLKNDLERTLTELFLRQMMTGGSLGQMIQNFIFLNLPDWYKPGLAAYIAERWDSESDDKLRHYLESAKKKDFNKLAILEPEFAGRSFWYMVAEQYGESSIGNILYLTRVNHNPNSGFSFGVGKSMDQLIKDWRAFFEERYAADKQNRDSLQQLSAIRIKKKNNTDIGDMKMSPDGKHLAFAAFDGGFFKVFSQDLGSGKAGKVAKGGFRSDQYPFDQSYPVLTWSKDNSRLGIILEKRDKIYLYLYDVKTGKTEKKYLAKFQRIYGADFTNNRDWIVFSAQHKGQTDLFWYNIASGNMQQLTNDLYDDLDPVVISYGGTEGILFSSNRETDELTGINGSENPTGRLDLFFFDLQNRKNTLARITETPSANETATGLYNDSYYSYLSDENGISNQYVGHMDSFYVGRDTLIEVISENSDGLNPVSDTTITDVYKLKGVNTPVTDFGHNIRRLQVTRQNSYYYFGKHKKRSKTYLYAKPNAGEEALSGLASFGLKPVAFKQLGGLIDQSEGTTLSGVFADKSYQNQDFGWDSIYEGTFRYTFQSDFDSEIRVPGKIYPEDTLKTVVEAPGEQPDSVAPQAGAEAEEETPDFIKAIYAEENEQPPVAQFRQSKTRPYRARFSSDYVITQLDNTILTQFYQSFNQNLGGYNFPNLSGMISFGISDLMEDHKLIGGFRIPFDFKGSEVFVKYMNLKKRIDKSLLFYRRSDNINFSVQDTFGNVLPFGYTGKTRTNFMETQFSFPIDVTKSVKWSVSYRNERLDVSYTDQISLLLDDIRENWLSARAEFVHDNSKEVQLNILNGFRYKIFAEYFRNLNQDKSNLYNVGFDIRHYQKVHRNLIWANRFAGATSFGNVRMLYFLGGVDTWLNQQYDNSIPIASNVNYGLQAPVTNMRGLPQNIRNGNNYLLWNSELRWPLFSYFAKKPLKSSFIRDFQLIGFFDAGIAYNFTNPFNKENSVSEEVVTPQPQNNPIVVTVKYYRNPFVFGYGGGVRTNLLGYFIRLDIGWGYDGLSVREKPVWHLSLSKDF